MTVLPARPDVPASHRGLSDSQFALLLTLPGLALFGAIVLYPFVASLVSGLFEQSLVRPGRQFVGLANYADLLGGQFWPVLRSTVVFTVACTVIPFVIGMALALALNTPIRASGFLRGAFLLPWVVPSVVVSFLWLWIFNANYGVLNGALLQLGLGTGDTAWLGQPGTAMAAVVVAKSWTTFPWMMVMLLAGLQTVSRDLLEAAAVDGADAVRRFFSITLPQIKGVVGIVLLLETIWNFQHFDTIYVLTGGGPAGATTTFSVAVYQMAFRGFDLGGAGALGGLWVLVLTGLVVLYVRQAEKEEPA